MKELLTEEEIAWVKEGRARVGDEAFVKENLPKRKRNSHKGSYGRAAIVAGSIEYTGAAYLSAAACLRSGAGYTTLFLPKTLLPAYALKLPEILLRPVCEGERYAFDERSMKELLAYDSVAYGMGMGCSEGVFQGAKWLLENYTGKLLLDADGLNSLARYGQRTLFSKKKCEVVITPHILEFSRLTGRNAEEILEKSAPLATAFAKENGVTVLLKNARSVVTDGKSLTFIVAGNSGQAKGGSGDVLSGIIAALCAQGASTYIAAVCGGYLAGKAAELAAKEWGEYSLTAGDCIARLGKAFLSVAENADDGGNEE